MPYRSIIKGQKKRKMIGIENITSKRLFIAIPLPDSANQLLNHYCEQIAAQYPQQKIRFTPMLKRHITLTFLGVLAEDQIKNVCTIVREFEHPAITIQLNTISRFPDAQSKIITALPAPSKALDSLHTQLQQVLELNGFPKLSRPYRPHISLTRIKNLEDNLPITIKPPIDMLISNIILYESQLTETGSLYVPMETTKLLKK